MSNRGKQREHRTQFDSPFSRVHVFGLEFAPRLQIPTSRWRSGVPDSQPVGEQHDLHAAGAGFVASLRAEWAWRKTDEGL
jgi:hypothetical protein